MTKKKTQTTTPVAVVLLLAILIILGGLITGKLIASFDFSSISKNDTSEHIASPPLPSIFTKAQEEELEAMRQNMDETYKKVDYLVAVPHSGPLIETLDINVEYSEKDQAQAILPDDKISIIKVGQDVILYDKEDYVLPLGAKVAAIDKQKIIIALPQDTNFELLSNTQSVITKETQLVRRLPLTALQQDEQGKTYIWRVDPEHEHTMRDQNILTQDHSSKEAYLKRFYMNASDITKGDSYFAAPYDIDTYDLIVLNPKAKTRSDKAYQILNIALNAPLHNPIKEAWYNYREYAQQLAIQKHEKALYDCQHGVRTPRPGDYSTIEGLRNDNKKQASGKACGGNLSFTDPVAIFKQLTALPNEACNTSCGQ